MMDPEEALRKIRRWASFHSTGGLTDVEMANAFLTTVMEAPLSVTDECLAALPSPVRVLTLEMLTAYVLRDYYDDRHVYVMDGRTLEQRREHYRQMQPHYRSIGEYILPRLRGEIAAEPEVTPDCGGNT